MTDTEVIHESHEGLLTDESRLASPGVEVVYLPGTPQEVASALSECAAADMPVTISAGRTGITGGAVPMNGGALLSLSGLTYRPVLSRRNGEWVLRVGAGTTIEEIRDALRDGEYDTDGESPPAYPALVYPVDPTEQSATAGGTVATNASGARTFFYGPTREWVRGLRIVMADGRIVEARRGQYAAEDGLLILELPDGGSRAIRIPDIPSPDVKHTAGYRCSPNADLIDLIVGSEGTLAVVTDIDLALAPAFPESLYLCVFLAEDRSMEIVSDIIGSESLTPTAIEYMDSRSVDLLRAYRAETGEASGVPDIPPGTAAVLYLEHGYSTEEEMEGIYGELDAILSRHGASLDRSWAGFTLREGDEMKAFRHALPEKVNSVISERKRSAPGITKIGTDMAVPGNALPAMMETYRRTLDAAGLDYCIFGHIGNGHLHVNILPRNSDDYNTARELYTAFAENAVALGGSVAGEHGIGRLKKKFMTVQYGGTQIESMREIKSGFDPGWKLNPGVLFDEE